MAELNFKQIEDKLNAEFNGDSRKLIFWYDANADFVDDIDSLQLINAQVYHLKPDNQFKTKIFLEREDTTTNYLIYAPFEKPPIRENHLADTIRYSKEFFADRASLLAADLGIEEKYKEVIRKYEKFFKAKERTKRFYELEIEQFTNNTIEIALMSILCKVKIASFEEVVRTVLTDSSLEENKFIEEFAKFDLLDAFWRNIEEYFGYKDIQPTLEKFVMTLFISYAERSIDEKLPKAWERFISYKTGNIIAFLDNLMNNILYRERFDELSKKVSGNLNIMKVLKNFGVEAFVGCDLFSDIDELLIEWLNERLLDENTGAVILGRSIEEVCNDRLKKHFGVQYEGKYNLLKSALGLIQYAHYESPSDLNEIIKQYQQQDYLIDQQYRKFYYYYDGLEENTMFERLRDLVENIYSNEYLSKLLPKWNEALNKQGLSSKLVQQTRFYNQYVQLVKEKVVVIISDALRYETGYELFEKLNDDPSYKSEMEMALGIIPSYTRLGMAALLPHQKVEMTDDYQVLVDGRACDDLRGREQILLQYASNGKCLQFDGVKNMKKSDLKQLLVGTDVVYIYHNQIDARGDKVNTENEVFMACEEAISEIYTLVKKLNGCAARFVITADHGFIYKRDKLQESDKIQNIAKKGSFINRRFIVSKEACIGDGISSLSMGAVLDNEDTKAVSFPCGPNVFKVAGGGQNYVHGGSSPQEVLIPIIKVKAEKSVVEISTAQIKLVSMIQKVTGLNVSLDFIQSEAISSIVKETIYRVYFVSEDNEKISNENIYVTDKKEDEPQKRVFRLSFRLKDRKYDRKDKYYLVAYDENNNIEILRHEIMIDIAFSNGFGFNV